MDWLDQYLDGMGNYKTTVSPADTHIWGVKPKLNSTQQRMIFDATAQSELEYRQLVQEARSALEEHGMSHADVAEGIGSDPGSSIVGTNLSYSISGNNVTIQLPGNASQFNFTVSNSTSSFNITIAGYGSFSMLNYYDANNFENCYLSAYNFNNFSITFNPVYVTATETLISNGQYFTVFYYSTGSALFSISKSEIIEPVPTPSPTVTPSRTPTQTPSPTITPTQTPSPTLTQTPATSPTVTPSTSPTQTPTSSPTQTPSPTLTPTPTTSPTVTPTTTTTPTRTPTVTPTTTPTTSPTGTATPSPTVSPTASPAAAIAGFGTPEKIIVATGDYRNLGQNGSYTRKNTGDTLLPAPAPVWKLSGTGYGYSNDIASTVGGSTYGGYTFIVSPSSYIVYPATGFKTTPIGQWAYINVNLDVYGNPNWNTLNSQPDARDINNMPTFWAKSGNMNFYNGLISVCVSAESMDAYLPISTQMLSISGITLYNPNGVPNYNEGLYYCQPLTASGIDSDTSYPTGKMVWSGAKTYDFGSGRYLQLFLVYGIGKDFFGNLENAGRPSWRVILYNNAYVDSQRNFTMLFNFNTSAFGIPLSGWNSYNSYTSQAQYSVGNGRSNYPILSAATTVASRSSVNVTNANLIYVGGNGNGVYVKGGDYSGGSSGDALSGTVYVNAVNSNSVLYFDKYYKIWTVEYDYDNTFYAYKNLYAGTRVVPQSGWVDYYTNAPVPFTVK
jgi:hypothetical protein